MAVAVRDLPKSVAQHVAPRGGQAVRFLVLARLIGETGVARAEVSRDVLGLVSHKLSPAEFRGLYEFVSAALVGEGLVTDKRGRLSLTDRGRPIALAALGIQKVPADWTETRDVYLVACALALSGLSPRQFKTLARPDGLRATVVTDAYGLNVPIGASPARVRGRLAVVALERAFGNKLKGTMESGAGLPAKMSRMLAAQLLRKPRELGTDGRLLAALAAESVGATRPTIDAIRSALLRRYVSELIGDTENLTAVPIEGSPAQVRQEEVPVVVPLVRPPAANRPDLVGFVAEVLLAASAHAEGWPGNRKSFICHVWREIAARFPEWGLSEVEFKSMLAEAHRTGHLVLVNADLRDKRNLAELQASAIAYKNTVWHYVRLQD